jgi:hypothetical protein
MPTTVRIVAVQPRSALPLQLPPYAIFLIIALIEIIVAVASGGQWASFGEQSLWWSQTPLISSAVAS